eukprot:349217_1
MHMCQIYANSFKMSSQIRKPHLLLLAFFMFFASSRASMFPGDPYDFGRNDLEVQLVDYNSVAHLISMGFTDYRKICQALIDSGNHIGRAALQLSSSPNNDQHKDMSYQAPEPAPGNIPFRVPDFSGAHFYPKKLLYAQHPSSMSDIELDMEDGGGADSDGRNNECPICYEDMNDHYGDPVKTTLCGHKFHKKCLDEHLLGNGPKNMLCPYCRKDTTSDLQTVLEEMGYDVKDIQEALDMTNFFGVQEAVNWIHQHNIQPEEKKSDLIFDASVVEAKVPESPAIDAIVDAYVHDYENEEKTIIPNEIKGLIKIQFPFEFKSKAFKELRIIEVLEKMNLPVDYDLQRGLLSNFQNVITENDIEFDENEMAEDLNTPKESWVLHLLYGLLTDEKYSLLPNKTYPNIDKFAEAFVYARVSL